MRQLGVQEVDILSIVKSVTKYAAMIIDPATIRYHLEQAVYLAKHGRPGPVWIDIPLDVQAAMIDPSQLEGFASANEKEKTNTPLLQSQVKQVVEHFGKAERPVILVGNGVRLAGAKNNFLTLISQLTFQY